MEEPAPQQLTENGQLSQAEPLDEVFPDIQIDYPKQNEDLEYHPAMDLLEAMDEQGSIIGDADASNGTHEKKAEMELATPKPKTISAKVLREMDGLPAGSPINEALMLDVTARMIAESTSKDAASAEKKKPAEIFRERLRCGI